jgi:uncharacterized membrane protein YkvA (DUF1232 family)
MGIISKLKEKAKALKRELTALYYAYQSPQTPLSAKIILFITLGYALSPIDLIPDFIPVLGYLDDLLILPGLISLSIKLIPGEVMIQSRERAAQEPLTLRKNIFFAVFFILVWLLVIFLLVYPHLERIIK